MPKIQILAGINNIGRSSLAAILLCCSLAACSEAVQRDAESYVLPANYVGAFYIIFDQPTGAPAIKLEQARLFQIPDNGVLLTQERISEGAIAADKLRFFRQQPANQLAEISARWYSSIDPEQAYQDSTTYIFGGGPGVYSSSELNCDIHFRGFHIGTQSQILDQVNHFEIEIFIKNNKLGCD
ncbi:hypothetical protein WG68_13440 [Arsukibacterium ikkense]|uniref:DUF6843 domain-containing protein n=1 Tax=Arsukibacterium ikkense TaxID=336831 RepID=A0A0M2V2J3_9GAMM|nr:hypothetical protein [Arsukibacterium ikkense]KKO44836.1 hypothetical protein WG68_13440 [Arsukibacterium ikkense]